MWISNDNKKPFELNHLLREGFDPFAVTPETLTDICLVSLAIFYGRHDLIKKMGDIAHQPEDVQDVALGEVEEALGL